MWVEGILSEANVKSLVSTFLPLSVNLGDDPTAGQYLELFDPQQVSLVEDRGLRVVCGARIRWPVLGLDLPITVNSVTLLLCPSVPDTLGRDELVFDLAVEGIDFAWAPASLDDRIADLINEALVKKHVDLSWRFGETLSHVFQMPPFLHPLDTVGLKVAWGKVRVTSEAVVMAISFHTHVVRSDGERPLVEGRAEKEELSAPRPRLYPVVPTASSSAVFPWIGVAGSAALATVAAYVVVGVGARLWRFVARGA